MGDEVRIGYSIGDDEWARTAGLRREENVFPVNDCFYGHISFRIKDEELLGGGQFDMSVGDLAVGLARVLGELRTGACGIFKFQQSDDMLEASFEAGKDYVTVSHNLVSDRTWTCCRSALEKAIGDFVVSFTNEAVGKIPDLFGWRDMEILRYFPAEHSKT